jgi:2-deoxy-D-gluconate 3-dehydrogenase
MSKVEEYLDLHERVAMVTGAASGIGLASAEALAGQGADVVLVDLKGDHLRELATRIKKEFGVETWHKTVDITKVSQLSQLAAELEKTPGHVDILVNSAGVNLPQKAEEVTEEAWDLIQGVNLKGSFFCCQAIGRLMIKQNYGKIINISSQAGSRGLLYRAAYCSSKGGLDQVTRVLALEWSKHNIKVNSLAPTFLLTPFTEKMFQDDEFKKYVDSKLLVPRLAKLDDLTGAVVFLASRASDMMTGSVLFIDGGWTAH